MPTIQHSTTHSCIVMHIVGRVQGVGFRFFTYQKAQSLNLSGYVKNLDNGDVEIVACGKINQVEALIEWIKQGGPASANITHYNVKQIQLDERYTSFNVKY